MVGKAQCESIRTCYGYTDDAWCLARADSHANASDAKARSSANGNSAATTTADRSSAAAGRSGE